MPLHCVAVPDLSASERPPARWRLRVPEPMVMDEPPAAAAFHEAGDLHGPLGPQYELCARGMSRLLRRDGVVMDLGSGSGRYLALLAQRRPDIRILGVELSVPMLTLGNRLLVGENLEGPVQLVHGDMTDCVRLMPERVDLLSCVLALHQLPSEAMLLSTLQEIATIRRETGCAVWIWDLARLKDPAVMRDWIGDGAGHDHLFLRDAMASEAASWTLAELTDALEDAGLSGFRHCSSNPPLLQVHWTPPKGGIPPVGDDWCEGPLPPAVANRVEALRDGFAGLPG